jgi:predicted ATP-binding protein involved in virulence
MAKTKYLNIEFQYLFEHVIGEYKCFRNVYRLPMTDDNGNWCRWTVFLGNNNTGKTNLLKTMAIPVEYTYGYGVVRTISRERIRFITSDSSNLTNNTPLINFEDWLLELELAATKDKTAVKRKELLKQIITSDILPKISGIRFSTDENFNNYIEYQTKDGWFKLEELGYGYQSTLGWMMDLCYRLFIDYPDSSNPLKEPAIVLVDEVDLHLHPQWQRTIINRLSKIFPRVQFIVTTHSPFVIQSMDAVNLFTLRREGDEVKVTHWGCRSFIGWSIEEILSEVMELGEQIKTDIYRKLMENFIESVNNDDYHKGKEAYDELIKILHPQSVEHKLLKMQLSQLIPDDQA